MSSFPSFFSCASLFLLFKRVVAPCDFFGPGFQIFSLAFVHDLTYHQWQPFHSIVRPNYHRLPTTRRFHSRHRLRLGARHFVAYLELILRKGGVSDLVAIRNFVLGIEEVPDIHYTVHACNIKYTTACWRPAAGSQVRGVVLGSHDWRLQVLDPDPCGPVTDRQEELRVQWVAFNTINRAVVLTRAFIVDGDTVILFLVSGVDRQYDTLLCAYQIFGWASFSVYAIELPLVPCPLESSTGSSVGSPSRRVSHQSI